MYGLRDQIEYVSFHSSGARAKACCFQFMFFGREYALSIQKEERE